MESLRARRLIQVIGAGTGVVGLAAGVGGLGAAAEQARPSVMMPTGGDYDPVTLDAFAAAAAARSADETVTIAVVPSAYGDAMADRPENIALARERTGEVVAACRRVVSAPKRCVGRLAVLLNRADALNPDRSAALRLPSLDGVYILGGDQGIAMDVLAESPAESALTAAIRRGVVLAGTSAGAAVESRTMINGYVGDYGPADGLRREATLIWWGADGDRERGLAVGSRRAIYDQHFYQRGRFGRSLSTIALADERSAGASPVGVGADYQTGITNTGDARLSGVFGHSGVATIDYETFTATHRWVGPERLLSARTVVTNLLTDRTAYDLRTRVLSRDGRSVTVGRPADYRFPAGPGTGRLFLGGGALGTDGVIPSFVRAGLGAGPGPNPRLVVISADGYASATDYRAAIEAAGWTGRIETVSYGAAGWQDVDLTGAAAIALVASAPPRMRPALADSRFRDLVAAAVRSDKVVLADGPMAAALGARWSPVARPDDDNYEDMAVATFKASDARWLPGLRLLPVTIVPWLTSDYQWGRLYAGVRAARGELAVGIASGAGLEVGVRGARVIDGSVVVADGRGARSWTGANGTMGAAGVVLDVFAPGESVRRGS
ncbi:MAG: Type 1 glutamine amidotransferase-like domain-containing protein [Tetrasphaera sp.]